MTFCDFFHVVFLVSNNYLCESFCCWSKSIICALSCNFIALTDINDKWDLARYVRHCHLSTYVPPIVAVHYVEHIFWDALSIIGTSVFCFDSPLYGAAVTRTRLSHRCFYLEIRHRCFLHHNICIWISFSTATPASGYLSPPQHLHLDIFLHQACHWMSSLRRWREAARPLWVIIVSLCLQLYNCFLHAPS